MEVVLLVVVEGAASEVEDCEDEEESEDCVGEASLRNGVGMAYLGRSLPCTRLCG